MAANPHKYLIETNPVLTDLKQFMSSDYLLENLGYDPDQSAKRLGDGLYEQRLIQQAVVARTGQRFLDGQTSDEGMFKYLMNNAITSKQELNLALGVSLTSEQVAALTHDIVWMENVEVNGEQVLVPVLYLANANNRLAANGALIQGLDVTLIAGKELNNAGTLRASNNLSATAANDLTNSGLVEAGNRLDLLAGNNLVNKAGGIIAGRDVSLITTRGDVVNERTVTNYDDKNGEWSWSMGFADNAARIEATNNLSIDAGLDFNTVGSVVSSGSDLTITAGRDVNIVSAQKADRITDHGDHDDSAIKQLASQVTAGRDLSVNAGRDLTAVASELEAKRDVSMSAVGDMTLASATDEVHSYNKGSSVTRKEDHVSQVATTVKAGGDVVLGAGNDMTLIASRISAGNEAYLVAQKNLQLLAAQNSDYTLYDMEKKGGWGSKKTQRDEVTDVKNIGSEVSTGGDLTLVSGGDQRYQVAKLESGGDITLDSGGAIIFEGLKDLHDESHIKSDGDAFWTSSKGKGNTDETLRQTQMVAAGNIMIKAVDGLQIDVKQVNRETVSQSIDAMVKADPKLAWLKEAEARGDVDWRQVKEIHESFKYSNSGLGPASQLIIAILMSFVMGPAGLGIVGAGAGGAVATSLATTAVTSTINNKGNLGAALKETFSSDSLKGAAIAGVTAGVLNYADANWFSAASQGPKNANLLTSTNFTDVAIRTGGRAVLSSGISTAIGGGSFGDNLGAALVGEAGNVAMATGFNWVGDTVKFPDGGFQKVVAHALMGGFLSKAMGGDFATGAAAAGLNEAMVNQLASIANGNEELHKMFSQLTGVLVAAAGNGDLQLGADIAGNATQYNHNLHEGAAREIAAEALGHCQSNPNECDLGVDFSGLSVEDVVKAMRVEGEHGEGIEGVKPEAIAFIDGYMFSRAPQLRDDLYSLTESEASRLDMEQKATLAMSAFSLGQSVRSIGNFLQGLIGLGESTAILVKNADEAALAGAKATDTIGGQTASTLPNKFGELVLDHNTQIGVRNSKAGTISGAHNSDAFLESVEITGAKISNKITDVRYPGLVEYSYQLPRTNTKGELIGGYKPTSTKTTYDPKVLPDSKVADMSSRAAIQAESLFKVNPALREASIKVDGYHFQVTRNSKTGKITNSFITMPPRTN